MAGIVKTMVRLGVIGTAVGAGTVVVAGPDRVMALLTQAQTSINKVIDENIDDPIALRNQLHKLEREYPARIAEVRGELGEVDQQVAQLERDLDVSRVKVRLTQNDLEGLTSLIDRAESARTENASYSVVRISFDGRKLGMDEAYAKANRIKQLHGVFRTQAEDIQRDLGYLGQQRERLAGLLEQLEAEQAEFQAKILQLDHEVEAIARNERLIEMMEARQKRLDQFENPYEVASLDQYKARLADKRAEQEHRLQTLAQGSATDDYDQRARYLLDSELGAGAGSGESERGVEIEPSVIEIGPDADDGRVASRN